MLFTELKGNLNNPQKIYLFEGEDSFFRARGEEMVKQKFLVEPDFNLTRLDGGLLKESIEPLLAMLVMCPFLGDYRIISIDEWYPSATDFKNKELSAFFNSVITSTIVIINNKSACETLKKQSQVAYYECKKADKRLIALFLQTEAKKEGLYISKENCDLIAEFCLSNMLTISIEIKKLISYCFGEKEITKQAIEMLVKREADYKVYEMVDFIAGKKFDKAYEIINDLIDIGEKQKLFVSLFNHFRRLLLVSVSCGTDAELSEQLGAKDYAIKRAREQAKRFTPKQLMKITDKIIDYDAQFKSGRIGLPQALENSVFMILTHC